MDRVVKKGDGSLRFNSAPTSTWLPLYDATSLLQTLETVDAKGNVSKLHANSGIPTGQQIQSMRQLTSQNNLITHAGNMSKRPLNFISYRIIDGTCCAFMKVHSLLERGKVVFWDRWCLPRRLAERRELVSNPALDRHLMKSLKESAIVWGIESPRYTEPKSYAAKERAAAIALGIYKEVPSWPAREPRLQI